MLIQCLIERDGDTVVTRGGVNYVFRQNRQGHAVCEVQNDDHARLFLRMGPKHYRPYGDTSEMHARRLNMLPKPAVVEEFEEDGELFVEAVGIVEGRDSETAGGPTDAGEEGLFAEEASKDGEELPEPGADALVRDVASRLLAGGAKKAEAAAQLQKQFGLSAEEAKQAVGEVAKK